MLCGEFRPEGLNVSTDAKARPRTRRPDSLSKVAEVSLRLRREARVSVRRRRSAVRTPEAIAAAPGKRLHDGARIQSTARQYLRKTSLALKKPKQVADYGIERGGSDDDRVERYWRHSESPTAWMPWSGVLPPSVTASRCWPPVSIPRDRARRGTSRIRSSGFVWYSPCTGRL